MSFLANFLKKLIPDSIASNSLAIPRFSPFKTFSYSDLITFLRAKFLQRRYAYLQINLKVFEYNGRFIRVLEVSITT